VKRLKVKFHLSNLTSHNAMLKSGLNFSIFFVWLLQKFDWYPRTIPTVFKPMQNVYKSIR